MTLLGLHPTCMNPEHTQPEPAIGFLRMFPCNHTVAVCNADAFAFARLRTSLNKPQPPKYHCPRCKAPVRTIAIEPLP